MQEEILIQTGELKSIKPGFANNTTIVYSGMPNEKSFAITFMYLSGHASNIFYSKESTFITVIKHRFKVIEVTPEYIILKLEKEIEAIQPDPSIRTKNTSNK